MRQGTLVTSGGYTERVQGTCSCGAKLPSDALFCHRCGKPLREIVDPHEPDIEQAEPPAELSAPEIPAPVTVAEAADAPISLRNGQAVRVAVVTAVFAHIVSTVFAAMGLFILAPAVAVFFGGLAATLYSRRTGKPVDVVRGARVGWFMGLFWFLIATVLFTLSFSLQAGDGGVRGVFQRSFEAIGAKGPEAQKALQLLEDPSSVIVVIFFALGFEFLLLTLVGSMGGALAARLLHRKQS